jgi:hypothetical protein
MNLSHALFVSIPDVDIKHTTKSRPKYLITYRPTLHQVFHITLHDSISPWVHQVVAFQDISQEDPCAHFPVPTSHQILYSTVSRKFLTVVIVQVFLCASQEGLQETEYSFTVS